MSRNLHFNRKTAMYYSCECDAKQSTCRNIVFQFAILLGISLRGQARYNDESGNLHQTTYKAFMENFKLQGYISQQHYQDGIFSPPLIVTGLEFLQIHQKKRLLVSQG
jgi:hypothetical protein